MSAKPAATDGLTIIVDLGSHAVKAAVIERQGTVNSLVAIEEEVFQPVGTFANDAAYFEHQVSVIRTLAARLPLAKAKRVLGLFNNRELQVKIVDLPREVPPEKMRDLLAWESRKLLSPNYKSEAVLFAYRAIRQSPLTVALAVVPQSQLERWLQLLTAGNIPVAGAYPAVFAAIAAKEAMGPGNVPAVSLIDIGQTTTHIQIFAMGELKFYRNIPAGISDIPAEPTDHDWETFTQKIRFSFDYFRAVTKLGQIDDIRFYGGGARRDGFLNYARGYFAPGKADLLDLSGQIDVTPVLKSGGSNRSRLLPFYPALAVYLAGVDIAHADDTDLLLQHRQRIEQEVSQRRWQVVPLVAGALMLVVLALVMNAHSASLDETLALRRTECKRAEEQVKALDQKVAAAQSAANRGLEQYPTAWRRQLATVCGDHTRGTDVLMGLFRNTPAGLTVQGFEIRPLVEDNPDEPMVEARNDEDSDESGVAGASDGTAPSAGAMGAGNNALNDLGGELLVVRGTAASSGPMLAFTEQLRTARTIVRVRRLQSERVTGGTIRFLLKGELR